MWPHFWGTVFNQAIGEFAGQALPPLIFMGLLLSYSNTGSSNTRHHCRWLFCSASGVQQPGSPGRTGTSQLGTTYTQNQLAGIKPEGAQICKNCSPSALWKEGKGKKKTKGVHLGVPWQVLTSLTSLNFKGRVEVPASEIRKVFKKIFF